MIEEILPHLYRIEIPLPRSPLKTLNSYLIKGEDRFLLIDTGMNREECASAMLAGLQKLNVDLNRTDFFITHLHVDHIGLLGDLFTGTSKVYFNRQEAGILQTDITGVRARWEQLAAVFRLNGFPEEELQKSSELHPARRFGLRKRPEFTIVKEGDLLEAGDYSFRFIETPGHSPGHMCLYDSARKLLIAGDHILFDITPNITFWLDMEDSLRQYLASLEKVNALDINMVLPGHRNIIGDHKKRIVELQQHHRARANEVMKALEDGSKTAFQVAPYVTWDIDCDSWESFPTQQKWFAVGETIAHLKYLEEQGLVQGRLKDNRILFSLV
ncbi:MAG: MBL fold metallo-hydrolase [Chloroflexi bacterium]|nr:MBL fold metallo-hydrolase [Chloroflexota bacterium]